MALRVDPLGPISRWRRLTNFSLFLMVVGGGREMSDRNTTRSL